MTLIKDLIEIPDHAAGGDYVLALTEGVARADATIDSYVVTPQLVTCFDDSLKLIRDALGIALQSGDSTNASSKAAYLHGSFGSGKSHFMAMLDLILAGNTRARSIPELGEVIANHGSWLKDRKFLLVPYHLIGAEDLESAIFGGYVNWIASHHPEAELPAVYASALVLDNAADLRAKMGDDIFFAELNGGAAPAGGAKWGKVESGWTAERYDAASAALPTNAEHLTLVSLVVKNLLPAFKELHGGFVPIDQGLSIISRHAESLGYDGLVLFLDELILWLAGKITGDLEWAKEEGSKLAKLVEAGDAERPVPIVSFIARQRDLRELVGGTGSEQLAFFEALQWWEGRFSTITLEDGNLPIIANRRLLQPKSDAAAGQLAAAVDTAFAKYAAASDVLLGKDSERQEHAKLVYPFSPTLVSTLVDVSSVLQRNRTALKVMQALLVRQRDELRIGELIPVGDLYDVVAEEEQPFTEAMQRQLDQARLLYKRIRPQLMAIDGVDGEEAAAALSPGHVFIGHDRLVKTVMLAALVSTPALQDLTAARLEQLNAGSIESYIPGQEVGEVIDVFRQLIARGIGELEMTGDPSNPRIGMRLHGVDVESIISNAKIEDNPSTRREKVRDLLAGAVEEEDLFRAKRHKLTWRGTPREVDIVFGNIRDASKLPDDSLFAAENAKIVIDFPFDPDNLPPSDDLARVERFLSDHEDTLTICWLPSHFNATARDQLGRLVVLDYLSTGDNFERHASHLPPEDRLTAKNQIKSQGNTLRAEMQQAFEEAYGIRPVSGPRYIDEPLDPADQFQSLHHQLAAERPASANIGDALDKLCNQLLSFQYPAHPGFSSLVKTGDVVKVWEQIQRVSQSPLGRLEYMKTDRATRDLMLRIATPLELGETGENHFVLTDKWKNDIAAALAGATASDSSFVPTVRWVRAQLDQPEQRGLTKETANLVIATAALQNDYTFMFGDQAMTADMKTLNDDWVLKKHPLPDESAWATAVANAQHLFGWDGGNFRSADNVTRLGQQATTFGDKHREDVGKLLSLLQPLVQEHASEASNRLRTAQAAAELLGSLANASDPAAVVEVLAAVDAPSSVPALGVSIKSSESMVTAIEDINWVLLKTAAAKPGGDVLGTALVEALETDELVMELARSLNNIDAVVTSLLSEEAVVGPEVESPVDGGPAPIASGREELGAADLARFVENLSGQMSDGQKVTIRWEISDS